jgi:hypothetical protein
MKGKLVAVGMIACFMLSLTASQASANVLAEDVLYVEGVDYLGLDAIPTAGPPSVAVGEARNVMVNWSDDIIYHQFPAGQKVRTEVLLHVVAVDELGEYIVDADGTAHEICAVYTLTAHFKIEKMSDSPEMEGKPIAELYNSSIHDGLWTDGPSEEYSAEINVEGVLLYGYNWDTRGQLPGWYRLTFWIEIETSFVTVNPYTGEPIEYAGVDISFGDPMDVDPSAGEIFGFVTVDADADLSYIDLYLTEKSGGRGGSGTVR